MISNSRNFKKLLCKTKLLVSSFMYYNIAAGILLIRIQQFLMLSSYNFKTGNIQNYPEANSTPVSISGIFFNMNNVIKTARTTRYIMLEPLSDQMFE